MACFVSIANLHRQHILIRSVDLKDWRAKKEAKKVLQHKLKVPNEKLLAIVPELHFEIAAKKTA